MGEQYGHFEDPAEDVFVGNIVSKRGNYLVLEGIWESATFYLQRFVNLVDELPDQPYLNQTAEAVHSLLKLSDLVCRRAGLTRNALGDELRVNALSEALAQRVDELQATVRFTLAELAEAGIDVETLRDFAFDGGDRRSLLSQSISHSDLERRPVAFLDREAFFVLPTAVSAAIRRFFIERLGTGKNRATMLRHMGREYSHQFERSPLLGVTRESFPFFHAPWGSMCCMSKEVDEGRSLVLAFVLDTLEGFEEDGFGGVSMADPRIQEEISQAVSAMQDACAARDGFRDGLALVVACGVGRGAAFAPLADRDHWETEHISAADFCTLSWSKDMRPLQLWRLLRMRQQLRDMNVWLQNLNGLLNLVAWADSLKGHLVPHGDIPSEAIDRPLYLAITQNALLDLRHEVATACDVHAAQFIDGTWLTVQTEGRSLFAEDSRQPVYAHLGGHGSPELLGACVAPFRTWWFVLASPKGVPSTSSYERWKMLSTWCRRSVTRLEAAFAGGLGAGPVLWRCTFLGAQGQLAPDQPGGTSIDAERAIDVTVQPQDRTIQMTIGPMFDSAIFNAENVAEVALVRAFIKGVAELAGEFDYDDRALYQEIVPGAHARQSHAFPAREFRDFIPSLREEEPIVIGSYDDGLLKLGLGWKVRNKALGGVVEGKEQCVSFLNTLVRRLEDELCEELRDFDRTGTLSRLLTNHEAASASRDRWHRTAAAVLALREDPSAALAAMRDHEMKLNAVFQCSRTVIEMAICECPLDRGHVMGELDLTRMMAKASQIYHLGGWSDLAHWGFLEPRIVIQALGDVHASHDFQDTVMDGFTSASSEVRFMASARRYEKNVQAAVVHPDVRGKLDDEFLSVWREEFGVELDAFRRFLDAVEDWGIKRGQAVGTIRRSALEALADDPGTGAKIVAAFSLFPRSAWRALSDDYDDKDIAAWRFRRRLSALRRPILHLSVADDPEVLVAPGLLREGFAYTVGNYFYGSLSDRHLGPAMRRYAGRARRRDGIAFNAEVAQKMSALGWKTHSEVPVTKILAKGFNRDFGDVDVLAWDDTSGRILLMECKDLQFRKTHGEIAEQLSDFAGVVKSNGKRDLLRKHLDRVELLRAHPAELRRFLGIEHASEIESHLVFRNPVPMQHVADREKQAYVIHTLASIESLTVGL